MRTFRLVRSQDVSGVSGTGVVAEGVEFSDFTCAIRWLSKTPSLEFHGTIKDMIAIHGHGGKIQVVFDGTT